MDDNLNYNTGESQKEDDLKRCVLHFTRALFPHKAMNFG
jgi:hypothetical protein